MLPPKLPKKQKRSSRWRSQKHCNHVRSYACTKCEGTAGIEVAHVRLGSGAGMGQKPDDWNTVSLCGGPNGCHAEQHRVGERTFWQGIDVHAIIEAFIESSPARYEIRRVQSERADG